MDDSPWKREGPTIKEAKIEYMSELLTGTGKLHANIIEKYVNIFIAENMQGDHCPMGSWQVFMKRFNSDIATIKKLIAMENL